MDSSLSRTARRRASKALRPRPKDGMVRIVGGAFMMGSDKFYDDEKPVRPALVGDFWLDETPVTNGQFARFIEATSYVTFAERPPNPADYPGMKPEYMLPGSIVFSPPSHPVDLIGGPVWWRYALGACWFRPLGENSTIEGIEEHPVVHIVHEDAEAYARWAGKRLPSEAEWEYAARGGREGADYQWGDEFEPNGKQMAKTFQGEFPWKNDAPKGLERTSPVKSYPANAFGLYDMIGNVWEWTSDPYTIGGSPPKACCSKSRKEMAGGISDGAKETIRRVLKGGSHLCAPSYCQRYRPAARWPQPIDTSTSHTGFRCAE